MKELENNPSQEDLDGANEKLAKVESEFATVSDELKSAKAQLKEFAEDTSKDQLIEANGKLAKAESEIASVSEQLEAAKVSVEQQKAKYLTLESKIDAVVEKGRRYKLFAKKALAKLEKNGVASGDLVNADSAKAEKKIIDARNQLESEKSKRKEYETLVQRRDKELADEIAARDADVKRLEKRIESAVESTQRERQKADDLESKLEIAEEKLASLEADVYHDSDSAKARSDNAKK